MIDTLRNFQNEYTLQMNKQERNQDISDFNPGQEAQNGTNLTSGLPSSVGDQQVSIDEHTDQLLKMMMIH